MQRVFSLIKQLPVLQHDELQRLHPQPHRAGEHQCDFANFTQRKTK